MGIAIERFRWRISAKSRPITTDHTSLRASPGKSLCRQHYYEIKLELPAIPCKFRSAADRFDAAIYGFVPRGPENCSVADTKWIERSRGMDGNSKANGELRF